MNKIEKVLKKEGYKTVSGYKNVKNKISLLADGKSDILCSGFGVLPSGEKCKGCSDCKEKK